MNKDNLKERIANVIYNKELPNPVKILEIETLLKEKEQERIKELKKLRDEFLGIQKNNDTVIFKTKINNMFNNLLK